MSVNGELWWDEVFTGEPLGGETVVSPVGKGDWNADRSPTQITFSFLNVWLREREREREREQNHGAIFVVKANGGRCMMMISIGRHKPEKHYFLRENLNHSRGWTRILALPCLFPANSRRDSVHVCESLFYCMCVIHIYEPNLSRRGQQVAPGFLTLLLNSCTFNFVSFFFIFFLC